MIRWISIGVSAAIAVGIIVYIIVNSTTLDLQKIDNPDPVSVNSLLVYTLTVTNNGLITVTNVELQDTLPNEVTYSTARTMPGIVCDPPPANIIICDLDDIDPGESKTLDILVNVNGGIPDGTIITNTAAVTSDQGLTTTTITETTTVENHSGLADYGDAPDGEPTTYPSGQTGNFATSIARDGARTIDLDTVWLGSAPSEESGYRDPADPDGWPNSLPPENDSDDGVSWYWLDAHSSRPKLIISLNVGSAQDGKYYVNVLQDHNMDGDWFQDSVPSGGIEWPIDNKIIGIQIGQQIIDLEPIHYPVSGFIPDCVWTRVAITTEPVGAGHTRPGWGWEGTGLFQAGEIEDWLIKTPGREC